MEMVLLVEVVVQILGAVLEDMLIKVQVIKNLVDLE
jgi:hypothetical protein